MTKARFTDEQRDVGCCQLFVDSLSGPALVWFTSLESNSIDNFDQLSTAFLKHYRILIERGVTSSDLWEMAQELSESIGSFLSRFKEKLTRVTVPEDAAMAAFRTGLIPGSPLRKDLNIREPKDLDDALHRASRFALDEDEDAQLAAKTIGQPSHPLRLKAGTSTTNLASITTPKTEKGCRSHGFRNGGPKQTAIRPKGVYLFGEIEATFQPKSIRGGRGRRGGWRGGRSNGGRGAGGGQGYNGPAYGVQQPANQVLANHQEEMPQADELSGPPKRQRWQNPERANSPSRGRITMILGPPEDCADSVRELKKRARQVCSLQAAQSEPPLCSDPISFTSEDAKGIQHPHSNPLVIEVAMGNFDVERVLVDTGSTVNVICWQTLEKISVTQEQLKPEF
ncbi:PREDICTED: uncharacterized protein LOC104779123 [Camelina sativa]|uniref:Uncharacterized protein LOC104779123 n=1 Tax=Camelina sativa TaxID=90675 RepID=A0ABM0YJ97_CAMSA|nr:PREDICTED: uncharacterized protein LOC104779123 [Camelina sativa]